MTDRHKLLRECREELQESIDNEGKLASFAALIKRIDAALAEPQEQNVVVTAEMVDRFLSWPLPESVCADLCTTESSFYQKRGYTHDGRCGTNLLSEGEARQMLEHVLNVAPQPSTATGTLTVEQVEARIKYLEQYYALAIHRVECKCELCQLRAMLAASGEGK